MKNTINKINNFLHKKLWCDFEIISLKGDLKIGGKTSFEDNYDIEIIFEDVFFMQCLYEWQTETKDKSFLIPELEERREINSKYQVEQGNTLFKIIADDIKGPMYVCAKNIRVVIP